MRSASITSLAVLVVSLSCSSAFELPTPPPLPLPFRRPRVLFTNDDSVFEMNLVENYKQGLALKYDAIYVANAENESGTGNRSTTPYPVPSGGCFFDECPAGSPAIACGTEYFEWAKNVTPLADPARMCWVNAYPSDAVAYAMTNLSKQVWGEDGKPDITVAGPNVGLNTGSTVLVSGTVNAANASAHTFGVPSIGFSGNIGTYQEWQDLNDTESITTRSAVIYAELALKLVNALLYDGLNVLTPILPQNIMLNVNMDAVSANCSTAADFKYVLTRVYEAESGAAPDVYTCGTDRLPYEKEIIPSTVFCPVTVSVVNATTKSDTTAETQLYVLEKLASILECAPSKALTSA